VKRPLLTLLTASLIAAPAFAIDHDNIDAGRPLRFEDAEAIGFRERAFETGLSPTWARGSRFGSGLSAEYLYGFALNTFYSVDFDASNQDVGRLGVGVFHNFRRETLRQPGLAVRFDTLLPTGTDPESRRGVDLRLRGIASRTLRGAERLHLNVDGVFRTAAGSDHREFVPAVTVGYTRPVGYPRRFDRTVLAEVGYRSDEHVGAGGAVSVGLGLRQQMTPRSVADFGIQSDVAAGRGASRDDLRLVGGYSTSF